MTSVDRPAAPVWPVVVWWWDRRLDIDVPATHGICWVELVQNREARFGQVPVSQRTADPENFDDAAVKAELHYQLQRSLATMINVDHASRHLNALCVDRRLAVLGCPTVTVPMDGVDGDVLGGLTVGPGRQMLMVVRHNLEPAERDQLLLWAEAELESQHEDGLGDDWDKRGWTPTKSGWQILARSRHLEPSQQS
ncbi:MAG TPA: hypothetical protein VIT42_05045 [Microlunatus sp.]